MELPRIIITKLSRQHVKHFNELHSALYQDTEKKKPNSKVLWEASKQLLQEKERNKVITEEKEKYQKDLSKIDQKYQGLLLKVSTEFNAFKEEVKSYFMFLKGVENQAAKDRTERGERERKIVSKVFPQQQHKKHPGKRKGPGKKKGPASRGLSALLADKV